MRLPDYEVQEFDASKVFVVKVPDLLEYDEYQNLKKSLHDVFGHNKVLIVAKDLELETLSREDLIALRDNIQSVIDGTNEEDI